jgi:chromosome partitioning protein
MRMAKVISFINYKGGVGKSTTAYHIGCSLALHHGKRVMLVDGDPQTNLTFLCASPERWQEFRDSHGTLASLYRAHLDGASFDVRQAIWRSPIEMAGRSKGAGSDQLVGPRKRS